MYDTNINISNTVLLDIASLSYVLVYSLETFLVVVVVAAEVWELEAEEVVAIFLALARSLSQLNRSAH